MDDIYIAAPLVSDEQTQIFFDGNKWIDIKGHTVQNSYNEAWMQL